MASNGNFFPPVLKSSASVDSGITFDSDSNEFYEAEDSRPSTAFASAEEDEGDSKTTLDPSCVCKLTDL